MRRIAASVLLIFLLLACVAPVYAGKHHINKEARAAQKRNKARAKAMKEQFRAQRKAAQHPASHH